MRLSKLLMTAAAAGLAAFAAAAQDSAPAPQPQPEAASPGLSGLEDTVRQLEDAPPPVEQPQAAPEAAPPAQPDAAPATAAPEPQVAPPPPVIAAAPPPPLTRAQIAQLAAATQRGRLLGVIARAGQVATRDMLTRVSDPDSTGITGWIAESEGNGDAVTFYADGASGPALVYRVTVLGGRVVSRAVHLGGERPPLTPLQARMAAARAATDRLDHQACGGQPFNVFVIPPATPDGPIDVYQISAQTQRGHFPVGGHFRSTVAADGTVSASRGFTAACLDLVVPELPAGAPAGAPARPLAITHLLDPLPTEIHVFLAIWTGRPLVVVADDPQRLFAVTGEGIAEIRP